MPRRSITTLVPKKLPPCDGPKLHRFQHHDSPIEWLERLDSNRGGMSGNEGYVFRAKIEGHNYAIKIFNFFDPSSSDHFWGPLMGRDTPFQAAAYYTDPFYAECRAYGRIQDAIRKGKLRASIVVPCHGFLFLQESDERFLGLAYNINFGLDDIDAGFQRDAVGGMRVRAIVKDLASPNNGVRQDNLRSILKDLRALNKQKVYNMDVRLENYLDGKLVDFGSAWTEPYPPLDAMDEESATTSRRADLDLFDQMVEDEDIPNPKSIRATKNVQYCRRLRPRKRTPLS